jgi:hypothetical protein
LATLHDRQQAVLVVRIGRVPRRCRRHLPQ